MKSEEIILDNGKVAIGYLEELGPVNIVFAKTEKAMIGCGVFNVKVFDKFGYPAARIKGLTGRITTVEDLLIGQVVEVNDTAASLGIIEGITGKDVLEKM